MNINNKYVGMSGAELLEWLSELSDEELAKNQVYLDTDGIRLPLITAKFYSEGIYLVYK